MEALYFGGLAAVGIVGMKFRRTLRTKQSTCHQDGSTDCPCMTSEKRRAPKVAPATAPTKVTLAPGESAWLCTCGASAKFPFCDGSHRAVNASQGTKFVPREIKNTDNEAKDIYACACGHTKREDGLCDGTHKRVVLQK